MKRIKLRLIVENNGMIFYFDSLDLVGGYSFWKDFSLLNMYSSIDFEPTNRDKGGRIICRLENIG